MNILQVSSADRGGGAEQVAWNLFWEYRKAGHGSWLAVGRKRSAEPGVFEIGTLGRRSRWTAYCERVSRHLDPWVGRTSGVRFMQNILVNLVARPRSWPAHWRGHEDFDYPGTGVLLEAPSRPVSILHGHNLHGDYFDLRALPKLCRQAPLLLTMHDAWLLSGHCAHSLSCARWENGCGQCPRLDLPPAIMHDGTAYNWTRKREIYRECRLHLAAPSAWLLDKVSRSILNAAVVDARVIRNGVDLGTFLSGDKRAARKQLGLSPDAHVLLFSATGMRRNLYKDFSLLQNVMEILGRRKETKEIILIALGEKSVTEQYGNCRIEFVKWQEGPTKTATYYQAADLYVHAAKAETFPTTILEALACGTPVVATAVGGIPEQVVSLAGFGYDRETKEGTRPTGVLTAAGDAEGMSCAVQFLLADQSLRGQMSDNALRAARENYGIPQQAKAYLEYYETIQERFKQESH